MRNIELNTREEYIARINKVLDYIEQHIEHPFTLDELAQIANFSKYHFHRLFHALVHETPFQFIQRIRLEKAALLIASHPHESISSLAFQCGFSELSNFSRNFKNYFGVSASNYRQQKSNLSQVNGNSRHNKHSASMYFCSSTNQIKWRTNMELSKGVEVRQLPKMTLAYIRYTGPYKGNEKLFEGLWNKLFKWAGPRGLIGGPDFKSLVIYHDDPHVTDEDKLRMSVCITVAPETQVSGEVGKMEIDAATYGICRFEVDATQFAQAWEWVYSQWLPGSGYQPDDKPCFEMYPEEPKDGKFKVDICIPVKPL